MVMHMHVLTSVMLFMPRLTQPTCPGPRLSRGEGPRGRIMNICPV